MNQDAQRFSILNVSLSLQPSLGTWMSFIPYYLTPGRKVALVRGILALENFVTK